MIGALALPMSAAADVPIHNYQCDVVADSSYHAGGFSAPVMNEAGQVAFFAGPRIAKCCPFQDVDLSTEGVERISPLTLAAEGLGIASNGVVWFLGLPTGEGFRGIYRHNWSSLFEVVATNPGGDANEFSDVGGPSVTSDGIVFPAIKNGGDSGIYSHLGGSVRSIAGLYPDLSTSVGVIASPYASSGSGFFAVQDPISGLSVGPPTPPGAPSGVDLGVGGMSVGSSQTFPEVSWVYTDPLAPGTFELRINGTVLVDQNTDAEITGIGGGTSINLYDDVLFVAQNRLYVADGSQLFRVQCVNESELPSGLWPPDKPLISDRAINGDGKITFRAQTVEFSPQQFVVRATPLSAPVPVWPRWATWVAAGVLGLAALLGAARRAAA